MTVLGSECLHGPQNLSAEVVRQLVCDILLQQLDWTKGKKEGRNTRGYLLPGGTLCEVPYQLYLITLMTF